MQRFPFWIITFVFFFLVRGSDASVVDPSDTVTGKRASGFEGNTRQVMRKVIFWSSMPALRPLPKIEIDYEAKPPNFMRSLTDASYLTALPQNYRDFLGIFRLAWMAYESDFSKTTTGNDLELMKWSKNNLIESISFNVHLNFLTQILDQPGILRVEQIWDLVEEYIQYTFKRSDACFTSKQFSNLLLGTIKTVNFQCFKVLLSLQPENVNLDHFDLWETVFRTILNSNLALNQKSGKPARMLEIVYELVLLGGLESFDIQNSSTKNVEFNQLSDFLPLLSALINRNPSSFALHFSTNQIQRYFTDNDNINCLYYWIDRFISFGYNRDILKDQTEIANELFKSFALPLDKIIFDCFNLNLLNLPQFILMNSSLARASIPGKSDQTLLLSSLVQITHYVMDYMKISLIIICFDLNWLDIKEHLIPKIEKRFQSSNLILGLEFILNIVESAQSTLPSIVPQAYPEAMIDTEDPYILDAARILLARQFKIPPTLTICCQFFREEASFLDLASFMNFFINLYRPDLGIDYSVAIM